MSPLRRNCLISALGSGVLVGSVSFYLQSIVVPSLIEKGNRSLVQAVATGLTNYYADFQRWPDPSPGHVWVELLAGGVQPTDTGQGPGEIARPITVGETLQIPNYLRDLPARKGAGQCVVDAWGRPLKFDFAEGLPARVVSAGRDGRWYTADDLSIEAPLAPRNIRPAHSELLRAQALLREAELTLKGQLGS